MGIVLVTRIGREGSVSPNENTSNLSKGILGFLRRDNLNNAILAYLNINYIRNKLDLLTGVLRDNLDVIMISETTIEETYPAYTLPVD